MNADTAMKIISMVEACAIWAAIFVVVYFIAKAVGMTQNLPKETKKRLSDLEKFNQSFIDKVSDEKPDTEKSMVIYFKKLKKLQRIATKVFAVYAYDHPLNVESNNVIEALHRMFNEVQKVSVCISRKQYEEVAKHLNTISKEIESTNNLLDDVITKDDEEKILNA